MAKLDIIYQPARPTITSEQSGDFQVHAVEIAGDPALLIVYTQDPARLQVLTAILRHKDAWYIAAGTVNVSTPDQARVDRYRAIFYAMFQSITITP